MEPTLPQQIATSLRRDILRGVLEPGAPIKERDTAADQGVSRTPMREAIRLLAQEGLVELRPSRSPVVARPTVKDVTDAITVLVALEELSGRLAVRHASDSDIAGLVAQHQELTKAPADLDVITRFEMDMAFHIALAEASHNGALAETHRAYLSRLWRARFLSARERRNRDRVSAQHGAIIDGLLARDEDRTALAIRTHLQALRADIEHAFEQEARAASAQDGPKTHQEG